MKYFSINIMKKNSKYFAEIQFSRAMFECYSSYTEMTDMPSVLEEHFARDSFQFKPLQCK